MTLLHPATLPFLREVQEHNSRKYFETVKPLYQDILISVQDFAKALIQQLDIRNEQGTLVDIKDCMFRIYRDARRLKEWDPIYKNNFWFVLSPRGKKDTNAGYYVHLEPGNCMFAGGIYRPRPEDLLKLRQKLANKGDEYLKLTQNKEFIWRFGRVSWTTSTNIPRGFAKDIAYPELVKMKQHLIYHQYNDEDITKADFFDRILDDCRIAKPFFDRLNDIS